MGDLLYLFLISLLASVIALIGGLVFLYQKNWENFLSKYAASFAAGVLIFVSTQNLIPESLHNNGNFSYLIILVSFLFAFLLKILLNKLHNKSHNDVVNRSIPLLVAGDSIHNFVDGIAIGTSFIISPALGLFTAFSAFIHEVPHEIADFGVMLKAGKKRKSIIIINLLSSLTTIFGAFLAYYLSGISTFFVGIMMSISAGVFLYLSIFEFLPKKSEVKDHGLKIFIPFLIGIILMFAIGKTLPHEHEEEDHDEKTSLYLRI